MSEYIVKINGQMPDAIFERELTEIVRCRDCEYYVKDPYPIDPGWPMMCNQLGRDMLEPDGYCAWAERREE